VEQLDEHSAPLVLLGRLRLLLPLLVLGRHRRLRGGGGGAGVGGGAAGREWRRRWEARARTCPPPCAAIISATLRWRIASSSGSFENEGGQNVILPSCNNNSNNSLLPHHIDGVCEILRRCKCEKVCRPRRQSAGLHLFAAAVTV
jgi:hypothetical protein